MANPNVGRFIWHELMTTDPANAVAFYAACGFAIGEGPAVYMTRGG